MSKVKGSSVGVGLIAIAAGVLFGTLPRNWIELFFRADPDGGSGTLEVLFALALVALGAGLVVYAARRWSHKYDRAAHVETLDRTPLCLDNRA
jgi:hypothetical protein